MKTTIQVVTIAALLVFGGHAVVAQEALLQPRAGESLFGPNPLSQTVQGIPLSTQVFTFLSLKPEGDTWKVNVRAVADLSDLQKKAGALVDTIPLPTDNCAKYSADNIVMKIDDKKLTIDGSVATLAVEGKVEVWTCLETWIGGPFKTRTIPGRHSFSVELPFWLARVDAHTLAIELGQPDPQLKGDLGDVAKEILKILGVDLTRQAQEALRRAINPDQLKVSLPEEVKRLNPAITRAELLSNSGALAATFEMSTVVTAENLGELLQLIQNGVPGIP